MCFDVHRERNMSEDDTIDFLEKHTRIRIEGTRYHYMIFVFSGHGVKGVLESQDGKLMSLKDDLLPLLFGKGLASVLKLIFLDACRSDERKVVSRSRTLCLRCGRKARLAIIIFAQSLRVIRLLMIIREVCSRKS